MQISEAVVTASSSACHLDDLCVSGEAGDTRNVCGVRALLNSVS